MPRRKKPVPQINKPRIEYISLTELQKWPKNPKDHRTRSLRDSFDRFGFVAPLIMDENTGRIVAGHGRIEALLKKHGEGQDPPSGIQSTEEGWTVPVIRGIQFKTEQEALAYLLADNQLSIGGGWIEDDLREVIGSFEENDIPLTGMGWTNAEVEALMEDAKAQDFSDFDDENDSLEGQEDASITIIVPKHYEETVREWLTNGEGHTSANLGTGVMKRCGLL